MVYDVVSRKGLGFRSFQQNAVWSSLKEVIWPIVLAKNVENTYINGNI